MNKRGLSAVVATVLIILLTVVAAGILASYLLPFVKDNLGESQNCFEILGELKFYDAGFTCSYDNLASIQRTGFSVQINDEKIIGFRVGLQKEGFSDSYEVLEGSQHENLRLLGSNFNTALQIPGIGGVRTYVARGEYDAITISPLTESGESCSQSDKIFVSTCTNYAVESNLSEF